MIRTIVFCSLLWVGCDGDAATDAGGGVDGGRFDAGGVDGGGMDAGARDAGDFLGDAGFDGGDPCEGVEAALPGPPACAASCCGAPDCSIGMSPNVCECRGCGCALSCSAADCQLNCYADQCDYDVGASEATSVACLDGATCVLGMRGSTDANVAGSGAGEIHVDCRDSEGCRVLCGGGKDCFVDCRGSTGCRVGCELGSRCQVQCEGATDCAFDFCFGVEGTCGGIEACRT